MRIAIDALLLGRPGGVGRYVAALLAALARYDPENTYLVYLPRGVGAPPGLPPDRFEIRRTRLTRWRPARAVWQQAGLPRRLRADAADLAHCPSYVVPLGATTPIVLTLHDVIALKHPHLCGRLNAFHYRRHLPRAVHKARLIIASSETTRRDILETCDVPAAKVRVIYPGPARPLRREEDPETREAVRRRLDLPRRYILFLGNLEPKKDLPTLVRAFARLGERFPEHGLVLAGAPLRGVRALRRLIVGSGLADRVRLPGFVASDALAVLYSMADVFVFPSLYEGFGWPPLEAMACGTPVVCSDGGALPEVVGGAARLFPAGDAEALAAALREVLDDAALRRRLVEDGQRRAAMLNWGASVSRLLALYREAAGTSGRV